MITNHGAGRQQSRQRFSDRIEFRRGKRDAQSGRAPASLTRQYMAGYTEGKRSTKSVEDARRPAAAQPESAEPGSPTLRA